MNSLPQELLDRIGELCPQPRWPKHILASVVHADRNFVWKAPLCGVWMDGRFIMEAKHPMKEEIVDDYFEEYQWNRDVDYDSDEWNPCAPPDVLDRILDEMAWFREEKGVSTDDAGVPRYVGWIDLKYEGDGAINLCGDQEIRLTRVKLSRRLHLSKTMFVTVHKYGWKLPQTHELRKPRVYRDDEDGSWCLYPQEDDSSTESDESCTSQSFSTDEEHDPAPFS